MNPSTSLDQLDHDDHGSTCLARYLAVNRELVYSITQAIGVALQRLIVRDQLRRAHVRRSLGGDAFNSSDSDCDGDLGSSVRASSQSSEGAAA